MQAPFVDPAEIRRMSGDGGYERGLAYFHSGAVRTVEWNAASSTLTGIVNGHSARPYRCTVRIDVARTNPLMSARCSCPMQSGCKHTVATLLASNVLGTVSERSAARSAAPDTSVTAPSWRELVSATSPASPTVPLALGVELRQLTARDPNRWTPRRAVAVTPAELRRRPEDLLVGLRPLRRSPRTSEWIKGDVSWDSVRRPGNPHDPVQARWFAELHAIARDVYALGSFRDVSEWVTLDTIESELLWHHLGSAAAKGIPFVGTKPDLVVSLESSAELTLAADQDSAGGLTLTPLLVVGDRAIDVERARPVGHSGIYTFEDSRDRIALAFAPLSLDGTAHTLLTSRHAITVPPADSAEFLRDHLPRLNRRMKIAASDDVEIPEVPEPVLVLRVAFRPKDTTMVSVAWHYEGLGTFTGDAGLGDRDFAAEDVILTRVEDTWLDTCAVPFTDAVTLRGVDAAEFGAVTLPALEALEGVRIELTGKRPAYRELTGIPEIEVSTVESTDPDWFDLGIIVSIEGRRIPFTPLFTALSHRRKKMLLSDGRYFSLAHPALDRLRDLIEEAGELAEWETGPRINRYQTDLWADFEDLADQAQPAVSWRATAEGLRGSSGIEATPLPATVHADLRPYQQAGFDWLAFLWKHRLGGILADDMGLGKTLQMLALIAHVREGGAQRPFLVVAPTSVLSSWQAEARHFTPDLRVTTISATQSRSDISVADAAVSADIVLTTYAILRLDEAEFAAVEWSGVVLDEAQFVKNAQTKLHRAVKALRSEVTFAVTGTPLENSLSDLWSLLSLSAPGLFPSGRRFREEYIKPIEQGKVPENAEGGPYRAARLARLRRRIRPLVMRRTKELVAPELPPKQEQALHIELGPAHRALYDTVLQRERQKVLGLLADLDRNRFIVFRSLTLLRMMSLAPGLVDPAHSHIASSKLDALFDQLDEVVAEGHRALIFSQFTSFLQLAAARLDAAGIPYAYLDGSTRRRAAVINGFREGVQPVFLISLKAGGFGLTLTEADYVFLLDPWWNPAAEAQAVDRTHRIGQDKTVMVYRMIAAGTIEEKVMALQQRKARLFQAVMDDEALFGQALTADDIRGLLED